MAIKKWDSKFYQKVEPKSRRVREMVPFHKLDAVSQAEARRRYRGYGAKYDFVTEHFFYPVNAKGQLMNEDRELAIPYNLIQNDDYMASLGYTINPQWEKKMRSQQDKYASFVKKMASHFPKLARHLAFLGSSDDHGMPKTALSSDTEQFVAWAVMKADRLDKNECKKMLDKIGVPFQESTDIKVTRGPLAKGETVRCDAKKNTNQENVDECGKRDGQIGTVVDVDENAVVVEFTDGLRSTGIERFDGRDAGATTGLYRHTQAYENGTSAVEVVYIKDENGAPPSKDRIDQINEYVERGTAKGENRSRIYYTGIALKQAEGKNGYYFTVFAQQRDTYPTSLNPTKGRVLYIGRLGKRPGGWKSEYAKMLAEAAEKAEG